MRQKHPSILRLLSGDTSIVERFWANVAKPDDSGGCWEWQGVFRRGGYPTFCVRQFAIPASHIAWFTGTGELPAGGRVMQSCGNRSCVRPSHLAWAVGRTSERSFGMLSDGYGSLSGVAFAAADRDYRSPRMVRLIAPKAPATAPEAA